MATCGVALSSAVALQSPRVVVREVPGMGLGVFAEELIACGSFVCDYEGEVVDTAEICRRYAPEMEPEYAFRVDNEWYIDAFSSSHWSKRINHDALRPNLEFEVRGDGAPRVRFTACRDIAPDDELCFDYGSEYWDGRSFAPFASSDSRIYAAPAPACEMVDLGCPVSSAALSEVMRAEAPRAQKRAAIMRALDYFGVDRDAIDVPTAARAAFFGPRSPRGGAKAPTVVRYEDASLAQLQRALAHEIEKAEFSSDDEDEDDDDADFDDDELAKPWLPP